MPGRKESRTPRTHLGTFHHFPHDLTEETQSRSAYTTVGRAGEERVSVFLSESRLILTANVKEGH